MRDEIQYRARSGLNGGGTMPITMILTGDINLMNVADPARPFAQVVVEFRSTDVVFSNLECCLYETPPGHSVRNEGFFAIRNAARR
jgi:poly-gamma-glutamate synthesis protein (capsule biosynthesis protein)